MSAVALGVGDKVNRELRSFGANIEALPRQRALTVDAGGVQYQAASARTYVNELELPAPRVTSCCFGGDNYDELYVTTAREGMSETELDDYPLSGSVFRFSPGVTGTPPVAFAG